MPYNIVYVDEPTYIDTAFVSELAKRGTVELHFDRPSPLELRRRLASADIAISEWSRFTAESIPTDGRLKHIALLLSAWDAVDLTAASQAGVTVSNCPDYCIDAVSDYVVACAYALARCLPAASRAGIAGIAHLYTPFLGRELNGTTIGLIGVGRIGQAIAKRAHGIGMRVVGCNRSGNLAPGVELMPMDQVIAESDMISIQLPYNIETHGILDGHLLSKAKRDSLWVNVGRFNLFCESSLEEVVRERRIAGIALDDCSYRMADVLRSHPNAIVTPGTAWYTVQSRQRNLEELIKKIDGLRLGDSDASS
ncbi:2-hydroxyacid dehydrogenase [Aestuariibius sp. 2305UL40-4]|uniref:2-hydroxyacid dehydrogenase n=1 Tax=Aestuariibius violaceus TaxID=3234132 RepID=UPI00345E4852